MSKNLHADDATSKHALRIVQQYSGVWTSPPIQTDTKLTTDAPMLGNGDVGVAILGNVNAMTFILSKNEFYSLQEKQLKAMVRMSMSIPDMTGASYSMQQMIANAEVYGAFSLGGNTLNTISWMQATDTTNNLFMTKFTFTGSISKNVAISFAAGTDNPYATSSGLSGDVLYFDARGDSVDQIGGYNTRKVRVAARVIGTTGTISNNTLNFTLQPGGTYTLITSIMSNYDSPNYQSLALSNISSKTQANVDSLESSHQSWWNSFWGKSFVEIPDKKIEKAYYGSLYLLASCSRAGEAAPGLWGNWILRDAAWNGDYHLNYNQEAPFYFALPTNHVELAQSYDRPILDWVPNGQAAAAGTGFAGVYYGVGIGPLPDGSKDSGLFWNQKTNAAFAASNMIMRYYATRDTSYLTANNNEVYNYLKQVATFWQNYLVWDGSRYVIYNDNQREEDTGTQSNGIMSLGLVSYLFKGLIDMSTDLNVDSNLRTDWQYKLDHLSAMPTETRGGNVKLRLTEVGRATDGRNCAVILQGVYPGMQLGLGSNPDLITAAKNTIEEYTWAWTDNNHTVTFYPAAAMLGYNPCTVLSKLDELISSRMYPNLHLHSGGGGIENLNTVPATISAMLMQSFQDKVRLFSNWPVRKDAKFGDNLADGGFLVSSEMKANNVQYMRVISQKGRSFKFLNPWPGQTLRIYRNGADAGTLTGGDITISTSVNETTHIAPDGTSHSTILSRMNAAGPGTGAG